jgi:hypothetical protein
MEYYQLDVSRRCESYRGMFTRNSVDEKKELWGGKCRLVGAPHMCVQNLNIYIQTFDIVEPFVNLGTYGMLNYVLA